MADEIDEYEQGERVRTWLRNNGTSLIGGVALGLAALAGWQWWGGQQEQRKLDAANEYFAFSEALDAKDESKAQAHATALSQDYPDTPYPALAALRRAELLHENGKLDEALAALGEVGGEDAEPMLVALAQVRAARLLVSTGKPQEALDRLDGLATDAYDSVAAEIRGDAEMALGRRDAARAAYEQALVSLDIAAPTRPMVEMKLTEAGGSPNAQPET